MVVTVAASLVVSLRFVMYSAALSPHLAHLDRGWRAACGMAIWILKFHFEIREVARGVTAMVVGSGALLGDGPRDLDKWALRHCRCKLSPPPSFFADAAAKNS